MIKPTKSRVNLLPFSHCCSRCTFPTYCSIYSSLRVANHHRFVCLRATLHTPSTNIVSKEPCGHQVNREQGNRWRARDSCMMKSHTEIWQLHLPGILFFTIFYCLSLSPFLSFYALLLSSSICPFLTIPSSAGLPIDVTYLFTIRYRARLPVLPKRQLLRPDPCKQWKSPPHQCVQNHFYNKC